MKKVSFMLWVFLSIASNAFAHGPALHWLVGNWEGTGGQVNSSFTWTITLAYKADEKTILLTYPSHNCGGTLKIISIETGKAECIEDVNYGLDGCVSGLKVSIVQELDGSITLTYYYPGESKVKSIAKLKRK